MRKRIDGAEGVFQQDCRKRCAFLKENNLCEMYERLGAESLCVTCANYPRHIEEFENLREITLTISCPEVARILLEQKDPVQFTEEEIEEEEEEFEDFDPFFFFLFGGCQKNHASHPTKSSFAFGGAGFFGVQNGRRNAGHY